MPNPQISRLRMLGLLFTLLGGTLIVLGWNGTAKYACVDCQVPYLLSGGFAGVGLIIIGVGLLVIAQIRVEGDKIAQHLAAASAPTEEPPPIPSQRATDTQPTPKDTELIPVGGKDTEKPAITDTMVDGKPVTD